jgi:endonuclease-3
MAVTDENLDQVLALVADTCQRLRPPLVTEMVAKRGRDPFRVLVATMLSARTRDEMTERASTRLFARYPDVASLAGAEPADVQPLVRDVGFHRTKAEHVVRTARLLLERHGGRVPPDLDLLVELPGVGRKTANLVLTLGFGAPGICVDTHVHRITNRWGYVDTRTPEQTERVLRSRLPQRYWISINDWLVTWGQQICRPLSPRCSDCPVTSWCSRRGVLRTR